MSDTNPWLQFLGSLSEANRLALLGFFEAAGQPEASTWSAETAHVQLEQIQDHLGPAAEESLRLLLKQAADFLAEKTPSASTPLAVRLHQPREALPRASDFVLSLGIPVTVLPSREGDGDKLRFKDEQGRTFMLEVQEVREDDVNPVQHWVLFYQELSSTKEVSPMSREEFETTILSLLHKKFPILDGVQLILSQEGLSPSHIVVWTREGEDFVMVSEVKAALGPVVPPNQLTLVMTHLGFQKEEATDRQSRGNLDYFVNSEGHRVFAHISHGMLRILSALGSEPPNHQLLTRYFKQNDLPPEKIIEAWRGIERIIVRKPVQTPLYELIVKSLTRGSGLVLELTLELTPTPHDLATELGWERIFKSPAGSNSHDIFQDPHSGRRFEIFTEQQFSQTSRITLRQIVSDILNEGERLPLLDFEGTILRVLLRYPWDQVVLGFMEPLMASDSFEWIREGNEFKSEARINEGSRNKRSFLIMKEALACFGLKPMEMPYVILTPLFQDERGRRFRVEWEGNEIILKILSDSESVFPIFQSLTAQEKETAERKQFPPPEIQGIRVERMEEQSCRPVLCLWRTEEEGVFRFLEPRMTPDRVAEFLGWKKKPGEETDLYQDQEGRIFLIEKRGPVGLEITQIINNPKDPLRLNRNHVEQKMIPLLSQRFVHLYALLLNYSSREDSDPLSVIHWLKDEEGKFNKIPSRPQTTSKVAQAFGFTPEQKEEGEPLFYSRPQGGQFVISAEKGELRVVQLTGEPLNPQKCITAFEQAWKYGEIDRVSLQGIQRLVYSRRSAEEGRTFVLEKTKDKREIRFEKAALSPQIVASLLGARPVTPEETGFDPSVTESVGPLFQTSNCVFSVSVQDIGGKQYVHITQLVPQMFQGDRSWIENFVRIVMPRISAKLAETQYVVYHALEPKNSLRDVAIFGRREGRFNIVYMNEAGTNTERHVELLSRLMNIFGFAWQGELALLRIRPDKELPISGHPLFTDSEGRKLEAFLVDSKLWLVRHQGPPLDAAGMISAFNRDTSGAGKSFTDAYPHIKVITPEEGTDRGSIDFMLSRRKTQALFWAELEQRTLHDYERSIHIPEPTREVLTLPETDPDDNPPPKPRGGGIRREEASGDVVDLDERSEREEPPDGKGGPTNNLHHLPFSARAHSVLGRSILTRPGIGKLARLAI